jgi:hypothetical protein
MKKRNMDERRKRMDHLVAVELHGLLLERVEVVDSEGVEQRDAGDGGHGRHGEVVHHRVRHYALHEPFPADAAHRLLRLIKV